MQNLGSDNTLLQTLSFKFFLKDLSICLKGKVTERERQRVYHPQFNFSNGQAKLRSQELLWVCHMSAGSRHLRHLLLFPRH